MSQALDFLKKLSSDDDLSKELQLCYVIATVKFASKKGYSFTPDEYLEASSQNDEQPLELDQLESVAGGVFMPPMTTAAVGEGGMCGLPNPNSGFDWGSISF